MRRAPSVFISHGSPMTALDDDDYTQALGAFGAKWADVRAVVVVSAHWQAAGATIGGAEKPAVIYDFGGFPRQLYTLTYPAPGDPALAEAIRQRLKAAGIEAVVDATRGLDHGVWVPLRFVAPHATIPVVPVALPRRATPQELTALGRALAPLRDDGVILLGSGAITHNLGEVAFEDKEATPAEWAVEFDRWVAQALATNDVASLVAFRESAPHAKRAHPTWEHLAPLFVTLGAVLPGDCCSTLVDGFQYGTLSMRSLSFSSP